MLRQRAALGQHGEQSPPQFTARLQHPRLKFDPIGLAQDVLTGVVAQIVKPVQADQLGRAFHEFFGQQLPVRGAADDLQRVVAKHHAAVPHDGWRRTRPQSLRRAQVSEGDIRRQLALSRSGECPTPSRSFSWPARSACGSGRASIVRSRVITDSAWT